MCIYFFLSRPDHVRSVRQHQARKSAYCDIVLLLLAIGEALALLVPIFSAARVASVMRCFQEHRPPEFVSSFSAPFSSLKLIAPSLLPLLHFRIVIVIIVGRV